MSQKLLLNTDIDLTSATSNSDYENLDVKAFRLYKFRFYGIGLKDIPLSIKSDSGKRFIISGNAHLLGTYIDIYFFALQEMSPMIAIVGVLSGICLALGITLLILKKVEDLSFIAYGVIILLFIGVYAKRKQIFNMRI